MNAGSVGLNRWQQAGVINGASSRSGFSGRNICGKSNFGCGDPSLPLELLARQVRITENLADESTLDNSDGASHQAPTRAAILTEVDPDRQKSGNPTEKSWMRMAGLGIELASITLGLAGLGYFVDSRQGYTTPYVTAAGALIGFTYGMFRFIQKATSKS